MPPPVAVNVMLVVEQVNTVVVGGVIAAVGGRMFCVILCVAVPVQPFAAVNVTV